MSYRRDKIFDILSILDCMSKSSKAVTTFIDIKELRIQAVKEIANAEFLKERYKNMDSAYKTVSDACRRRLNPDINGVDVFDRLADKWLHHNSSDLKEILLKHSKYYYQRDAVHDFFRSKAKPTHEKTGAFKATRFLPTQ